MNAGGSEAKKHVSVRDPGSGQGLLPLNRPDAEARKIIIARRIHARHFGRFHADERATCLLATFGYGRDDAFGHNAFQLAGRIVIKKEKRLRSDRKSVVSGKRVYVLVDIGGRSISKKKKTKHKNKMTQSRKEKIQN